MRTEELLLVEQRVSNDGKSIGVAFVLWLFLGLTGAHRYYVGKVATGVMFTIMLVIFLLMLAIVGPSALLILLPTGFVALIDAFLVPSTVRTANERLRQRLIREMKSSAPEHTSPAKPETLTSPDLVLDELWDWSDGSFIALMRDGSVVALCEGAYCRFHSISDWRERMRQSSAELKSSTDERRGNFLATVGADYGFRDKGDVKPLW